MKKIHIYIYVVITLITVGCAQITPLTGGKKDTIAPKVLKFEPNNASVNFNSKTITIYFDEYITLKDIANQFIITPQTKELPTIEAHGKRVIISFKEALLENTTYKLFFGNAITDLREANPLQNFEYIFTTGNAIDSLTITGKILNYINRIPEPNVLVALYPNSKADSVIYKEKPLYINKTNEKGEFVFTYMPNSNFKLIGIKDDNKNLVYDGSTEYIAFSDSLVNANSTTENTLLLFKENTN